MQKLNIGDCYITMSQLRKANTESIRLGFSRNLNLPPDLPELKFPIMQAFRHRSRDAKPLENIRLMIFFALDTQTASDWQPLFLDVTPDWWETVKSQVFDSLNV